MAEAFRNGATYTQLAREQNISIPRAKEIVDHKIPQEERIRMKEAKKEESRKRKEEKKKQYMREYNKHYTRPERRS